MLDVKRLSVLREVANRGSFSAAAESLYLSQSAVSQQVATLEREVGMQLLERAREGPKLTDAGRVLVSHADVAIARLDEAERELAAIAGLEGGELRLASFPSASATLVTAAVSQFSQLHPKVQLSVTEAEPEESVPRLRAGELDLVLTFDYPAIPEDEDRDLDRTLLLTESMRVALPRSHPLAKRKRVPLERLAEADWLAGTSPSSCCEIVIETCREAGFEPRISFQSDDYGVLQGYVAAGLGVTLLPDLALHALRPELTVRPIEPQAPTRRVWAETRTEGCRSPATEAMITTLTDVGATFSKGAADTVAAAA